MIKVCVLDDWLVFDPKKNNIIYIQMADEQAFIRFISSGFTIVKLSDMHSSNM